MVAVVGQQLTPAKIKIFYTVACDWCIQLIFNVVAQDGSVLTEMINWTGAIPSHVVFAAFHVCLTMLQSKFSCFRYWCCRTKTCYHTLHRGSVLYICSLICTEMSWIHIRLHLSSYICWYVLTSQMMWCSTALTLHHEKAAPFFSQGYSFMFI